MAQRDLISNVIAFEFVTKCDGFEFDAHSIHHRNDGTHLEYEGRQHRAEFVNGQRVVTVEHHVPPQSPTRMTNSPILKLPGAFHWVNTSSMRFCAFSYSIGEPCGRSFQVSMYFI